MPPKTVHQLDGPGWPTARYTGSARSTTAFGIAGECGGVLRDCPDHVLEELSEGNCGLVRVELEIDDDVAGVVDRPQHPV